jgi:membrane protein
MTHLSPTQQNRLDWLLQLGLTTARLFNRNSLTNHAAATAFYLLLSATPLLLLMTIALQWLASLAEQSNWAAMLLAAFYDQLRLDRLAEMGFIPSRARLATGGVGVLTLVLSSRGLVNAVQSAFSIIFPEDSKRKLVVSWTLPLIILPVAFLLVGLTAVAQAAISYFAQAQLLGAGNALLLQGLNVLVLLLAVWGLVFAAFWRLPLHRPRARHAAWVALIASLTLLLLFTGFQMFYSVENYRAVYGALGGVVFILIGAYFACLAFYFWAQCLYALGKVDVAALERLFLGGEGQGANRLEQYVYGRANRLLSKYGQTFTPGETLIREGDASQTAFFLYAGRVDLFKRLNGQDKRLGELGEGELFGEMAYLLGEKRTATVVAQGEVTVLALPPEMLEELMRYSAPLSRRIIGTLCQRLLRMNQAAGG